MLTNDLLKDTNIRVIKRINDNNFRLQINNKEYNMLTDFNKYCYINGDEESIVNFNINIIFQKKDINIIINELSKIQKSDIIYDDNYNIFSKVEEFSKCVIDYKKLEKDMIDSEISYSNIIKSIPKKLLFEKKQIIKLIINEIKKINRSNEYKHYIDISDRLYTFNLKLVLSKIDVEMKIVIDPIYYPFFPIKLEYVSPNINIKLLLAILNLEILSFEKWSSTISLEYFIVNLGNEIEKYIYDNLDVNINKMNYEIIKFSILTKESKNDDIKINIVVPKTNITDNNKSFWASGTGYGSNNLIEWDINNYIKSQEIHQEDIIKLLKYFCENITLDNIYDIYDSIVIEYIRKQLLGLTLLEYESNKNLYNSIFNLLGLFILIEYNQNIINKLGLSLKNFYEEISLTLDNFETNEKILEIYNIISFYIEKMEKWENIITISNDIKDIYCNVMKPLQFQTCDINKNHRFINCIDKKIEKTALVRILSEISSFKYSLPLNWETSIWVRIPKNNFHVFSFIISGPKDTPYENGLFEFHANFPSNYPNSPPDVLLNTTGSGKVRFNPNLYNTGKVCLSLLGTWSGHQSEQWNPATSTFIQVLVSIQSLILVEKPYFNEPGYEREYNTERGKKLSNDYNEKLYESTILYSMIDMLKSPIVGYEDVIREHFSRKKEEIKCTVCRWSERVKSLDSVRVVLFDLLDKL